MVGASRSVSLARVQLVVVLGVILGFITATVVSALRAGHLDGDVDRIITNAMPSVEHLSTARSELHVLDDALHDYVSRAQAGEQPTDDAVREAQRAVDASAATYATLPRFRGEDVLAREVTDAGAAVDHDVDAALAAATRGDWKGAGIELGRERDAIRRADAALARLVQFNADEGARLGRDALAWRRSTLELAVVTDSVIALLALAAAFLAALTLRRAVTDLESASFEAEKRASVSEERSTELEQFAGRVAHDVLSPLMAVGIGLQLSKAKLRGDPAAVSVVERASGSLMRVRRIVEGLLQFARAGAHPHEGEAADLHEAVLGVLDDVRADADRLGIDLVVEPFEAYRLACSPGVLSSLVGNLVRNAVKYMADAPVRRIVIRAGDAGPLVRVEVEDTGPGVAPDMQAKIFEPFVRAAAQTIPGAGLGLATVKKLAQAHGGRVACRSRPGQGSVFWFELPSAPEVSGAVESTGRETDAGTPLH